MVLSKKLWPNDSLGSKQLQAMTLEEVANLYHELLAQIRIWEEIYYGDNPEDELAVSDEVFDLAMLNLRLIEKKFPQFKHKDSPTERLGSSKATIFQEVAHKLAMLSLANIYNIQELTQWQNKCDRELKEKNYFIVVEPKIDGVAIALHYKNGVFRQALTRGDGKKGEDVTHNLVTLKNLPHKIAAAGDFEVRGEVYFPKSAFAKFNRQLKSKNLKAFRNTRNAAAGSIRLKSPAEFSKRKLEVILYDIAQGAPYLNHQENMAWLKDQLFQTSPSLLITSDFDEIARFLEEWQQEKQMFDFDTDGLVLKLDSFLARDKLSHNRKSPNWAKAWKYQATKSFSRLINIENSISRFGTIVPVAVFEPVLIAGTLVQRASLFNYEHLQDLIQNSVLTTIRQALSYNGLDDIEKESLSFAKRLPRKIDPAEIDLAAKRLLDTFKEAEIKNCYQKLTERLKTEFHKLKSFLLADNPLLEKATLIAKLLNIAAPAYIIIDYQKLAQKLAALDKNRKTATNLIKLSDDIVRFNNQKSDAHETLRKITHILANYLAGDTETPPLMLEDQIQIEKAGGIIPQVSSIDLLARKNITDYKIFSVPLRCPNCNTRLQHRSTVADPKKTGATKDYKSIYCPNLECVAVLKRQLEHFVSLNAFNIDGLGPKQIDNLFSAGLIRNIPDIFRLAQRKAELLKMKDWQQKSVGNLLAAIEKSKYCDFARAIYAFSINGVAQETADILASCSQNWQNFKQLKQSDFAAGGIYASERINKTALAGILSWLDNKKNIALVEELFMLGVVFHNPLQKTEKGAVLITGTLSKPRKQWEEALKQAGYQVSSRVTKNLDYLIVGKNPGSKLAKVEKLNQTTPQLATKNNKQENNKNSNLNIQLAKEEQKIKSIKILTELEASARLLNETEKSEEKTMG